MGSFTGQGKTPSRPPHRQRAGNGAKVFPGIVKGLLVFGALGLILLCLLGLAIHTPWIQKRAVESLSARIQKETGLQMVLGGFRWFPTGHLRLENLAAEVDGRPLFSAASVEVDYAFRWSRPHVKIRNLVLTQPVLRVEKTPEGAWRVPVSGSRGGNGISTGAGLRILMDPVPVTMVSGRIQGFDGDRCLLDVHEITGRLSLRGAPDGSPLGIEVSLEPWHMEFQEPIRAKVALTGEASYRHGLLQVKAVRATVNETSHVVLSGVWYNLPEGHLSLDVQLTPWQWTIEGLPVFDKGDRGPPTLEGVIRVEGPIRRLQGHYDLRSAHGKISGTASWIASEGLTQLTADTALQDFFLPWGLQDSSRLSATARIRMERTKDAPLTMALSLSHGTYTTGAVTMRDVTLDVEFKDQRITLRRAAVRVGADGFLETSGTITLSNPKGVPQNKGPAVDLTLKADRVPLELFGHMAADRSLSGQVSGHGLLQGTWPMLTWTGQIAGTDLMVADFRAKTVKIDGTSNFSRAREARKLTVEILSFGYGRMTGDSLRLRLRQDATAETVHFDAEGRRLAAVERMNMRGAVESLDDPQRVIRIDKGDFSLGGEIYQISGQLKAGQGGVDVSSLRCTHGAEYAAVQGTLRSSGTLDFFVQLTAVDLGRWLYKAIPGERDGKSLKALSNGRLDGRCRIQGSAQNPTGHFEGSVSRIEVLGLMPASLTFSGRYEKGRFSARGELTAAAWDSPVSLEADVPVTVSFVPWEFRVLSAAGGSLRSTARNIPLDSLQGLIPLKELKGRASWDLRLAGSLDAIRLEGAGTVNHAAFQWPGWGERLEDMEIHWRAQDHAVRIESAVFTLLGSRAQARGELFLSGARFGGYFLEVAGEHVRFPEIFGIDGEGAVSGTISQAGPAFAPDIAGKVRLTKAAVNLGELEKDIARQIRIVEEIGSGSVVRLGTRPAHPQKTKGFGSLAMELEIRLPEKGTWARGFGLEAEVQGGVVLHKARGGPIQLLGTLETSKGEYAFQGVRLKIVEGELTFRGDTPPDPFLSLTCHKNVHDYSITASLSGQLSRPTLVFSSSPEMDQVDIVSLLLYGRPARELSHSQARDIQDRGLQFVWGDTTPVVKSLLGGTPLSPDAVDIKGTENGSVLEIGKYLTPELYVTYQKALEGDDKDELRAEYRVNRYLSIESQVGREDRAGVDVFFRYDFGN